MTYECNICNGTIPRRRRGPHEVFSSDLFLLFQNRNGLDLNRTSATSCNYGVPNCHFKSISIPGKSVRIVGEKKTSKIHLREIYR